MVRVYVAGKLNDTAAAHVHHLHKMVVWAERLRKAGFATYVPCLSILQGIIFGTWEYEDYFSCSQPWLACSQAVFLVPGWQTSKGVKREIELAEKLEIPIFTEISELRKWAKNNG